MFRFAVLLPRALDRAAMTADCAPVVPVSPAPVSSGSLSSGSLSSGSLSSGLLAAGGARG